MQMRAWFGRIACLLLLLLALSGTANAETPLLRIETGMHEALTNDAATDASGRVLVTASDDRTARIWSLPDLRPLGVLRPAVGTGDEGKLYAVAVSPDGALAAVGGWTTTNDQAVLVFDLATRQVRQRLAGLPEVVHSLAFSADGTRLAAGLGGANGVRVWDTATWQQSFGDTEFGDGVYGLAFARDGRLAAISLDGSIRLYGRDGHVLARTTAQAGHHPVGLAFSPDDARLAIGFDDAQAIELRDGSSLALRTRPDMTGLDGSRMPRITWSGDGRTLFGAGDASRDGRAPIYAWSDRGAGPRRIADPGFSNVTSALRPLPGNSLALVSGNGDLAVLDASGRRIAMHLDFAAKDARDVASLLKAQEGGLYGKADVHLLQDRAATRAAVLDGLEWLRRAAQDGDVVILFLAGHGANDSTNRYWFLPADVSSDPVRLRSSAVAGSEVKDALGKLPSKVVAFVDICYAGNVANFRSADMTQFSNEFSAAEAGLIMFVSSTAGEKSVEAPGMGHGAFTEALLEGARGQADRRQTGAVTVQDLGYFINDRVHDLTNGSQHSTMLRPDAIRDFPLFIVSKAAAHP